jgi:hypothetical protein
MVHAIQRIIHTRPKFSLVRILIVSHHCSITQVICQRTNALHEESPFLNVGEPHIPCLILFKDTPLYELKVLTKPRR